MKIFVNQVPFEELVLTEELDPGKLDLETEIIRFRGPIKARAEVSRISNAITVRLKLKANMVTDCSRCLNEFEKEFNKEAQLNYPLDSSTTCIDLDPEIREELILDYPIKPLCRLDCKGLCAKCGKNLNEGGSHCGST